MKLFMVHGVSIHGEPSGLIIAGNAEQAEQIFMDKDHGEYIYNAYAYELTKIDGYKVVFKKGKKIALQAAGGDTA